MDQASGRVRRDILESLRHSLRPRRRRVARSSRPMLPNHRFPRTPYVLIALGVICLLGGSYLGLFVPPPEHFMGGVQRIMYVHLPTAWKALLALTFSFLLRPIFFLYKHLELDAPLQSSLEVRAP